jgi:predicted transposase/invertase (TIGR01784 family)
MINILNYELLNFKEYISETAIVLDKHRDYEVLKGIKWYFIELPKFRKENPNMDEKVNQWLAFIDDYDWRLVEMAEEKNETLKKARGEMEYLTGDEEVQRLAWLHEKWEMDRVSAIGYAKREGEAIGLDKGIKQGRKQGEKQKTIEIAKKMKAKGKSINEIMEITELTKEEIEKL